MEDFDEDGGRVLEKQGDGDAAAIVVEELNSKEGHENEVVAILFNLIEKKNTVRHKKKTFDSIQIGRIF